MATRLCTLKIDFDETPKKDVTCRYLLFKTDMTYVSLPIDKTKYEFEKLLIWRRKCNPK